MLEVVRACTRHVAVAVVRVSRILGAGGSNRSVHSNIDRSTSIAKPRSLTIADVGTKNNILNYIFSREVIYILNNFKRHFIFIYLLTTLHHNYC